MTKEKLFKIVPEFKKYSNEVIEQILIEAKYNRYIEKQQAQVERMKDMLKVKIPSDFDYSKVSGLSNEIVEKLTKIKPPTLFNASQISGVTPASLDILHIYIKMAQKMK
jgi:tRNA uridine 5-carboxymethylaminomethyl modification enzyme